MYISDNNIGTYNDLLKSDFGTFINYLEIWLKREK